MTEETKRLVGALESHLLDERADERQLERRLAVVRENIAKLETRRRQLLLTT